MKLPILLGVIALSAPGPALAQSIGQPIPGRADPLARKLTPAPAERPARPCPEYGPGFVRLEGSQACVRVGGAVMFEAGKSSARRGYGSSAAGRLYLEGRTETSFGSVRTVIGTQGRIDRNLDQGSFRYR